MTHSLIEEPTRRRFALAGLAVGAAALGSPATKAAETVAGPAQASGPIVLHGVSPRLTVHALDTFHGAAATGLRIDFSKFDGKEYALLQTFVVNANGRSNEPLLIDSTYVAGRYEFLLHADEYFEQKQAKLPKPAFLSKIPVRFQIINVAERIHLPIQFGPWSYTYSRGS